MKKILRARLGLSMLALTFCGSLSAQIPAFPGAEGFGAVASGGRGGQVVFVTNTNVSGPGSLQEALNTPGPKYILFRCSGVIDGTVEIPTGSSNVTIAGQTSPEGIVMRGLTAYNDAGHSVDNLIIRHIRSRSGSSVVFPTSNWVSGDGMTLGGVHKAVVDHCSFAHAYDEEVDISRGSQITIQNCMLSETIGEHFDRGGMLTNYSAAGNNLDSISIHHNTWSRIGGRFPEFSCESPECQGHTMHAEVSSNLYYDPSLEISYNSSIDPGGSNDTYYTDLNFVSNLYMPDPNFCNGMFYIRFLEIANNDLYVSDNHVTTYPNWSDYQLFSCCNDFCQTGPNTDPGVATHLSSAHPYPAITYTPSSQVRQYGSTMVGAFPVDEQDARLKGYITAGTFLSLPDSVPGAHDPFTIPNTTAGVLTDSDNDGMPDYWETGHGLNPNTADHNGTTLSASITGVAGYTNLECYLNCLADALVGGGSPACGILLSAEEAEPTESALQAYPNPSEGLVEVSLRSHGRILLEVCDLQGKVVFEQVCNGRGTVRLDLRSLPKGVYILRCGSSSRKLVLK